MRSVFKMFIFVKPYLPMYISGLVMHNSQMFMFALMQSLLLSRITAAVLGGVSRAIVIESLFLLIIFTVVMGIMGLGVIFKYKAIANATRDLKVRLFRSYIRNSAKTSPLEHSGEAIATLNTDADTAAGSYNWVVAHLFSCLFSIVMGSVVVFAVDYRLWTASLAVGGLTFFAQSRFVKPLGEISKKRLEKNATSIRKVSNIFSGGLSINAFNIQQRIQKGFDFENSELRGLSFKAAFIHLWQDIFSSVQGWLTLVVVFALGGWLVATEQLEFPSLMLVPQMCMIIVSGMSRIGETWAIMQAPAMAAKRILNILNLTCESKNQRSTKMIAPKSYNISISDLNFRYYDGEKNILSNINLDISENEMIAFVGASGSGKSTLLQTIIGMYERSDIKMCLGGVDFQDSDPSLWRKHFAYVDQNYRLFDMTISENIAINADGNISAELIKNCAMLTLADEFINELPKGYDTFCGEGGSLLSGGQRQRIAIARALYRKAPILVFDEITSALDADTENGIMNLIYELRKDHTILITTHNLHSIKTADKIVVLDNGYIVEMGTHFELFKKNLLYTKLFFEAQALQ